MAESVCLFNDMLNSELIKTRVPSATLSSCPRSSRGLEENEGAGIESGRAEHLYQPLPLTIQAVLCRLPPLSQSWEAPDGC